VLTSEASLNVTTECRRTAVAFLLLFLLTFWSLRVDGIRYGWRKHCLDLARPVVLVVEVAMTQVHRKLVLLRLDVRHSDPGPSSQRSFLQSLAVDRLDTLATLASQYEIRLLTPSVDQQRRRYSSQQLDNGCHGNVTVGLRYYYCDDVVTLLWQP